MESKKKDKGLAIICDLRGVILKVLLDDLGVTDQAPSRRPFIALVVTESLASAFDFLTEVRTSGEAFARELNMITPSGPKLLRLVGSICDDGLLIVGITSLSDVGRFCDRLKEISPVHCDIIRKLMESRVRQTGELATREEDLFDELALVCNELVTTQRALAKKNAELESEVERRKRAEQFREEYVSLISHDLRNPLTVLIGNTELLRRSLVRNHLEREVEIANTVINNARRLNLMVQELADSTRLESGQMELHREMVDLAELISEITRRVGTAEDQLRIQVESSEGMPPIALDRDRVERVMVNLLTNALKYSPPNSRVIVRVGMQSGNAVVSVSDNGIGIPAEDLPHIFDRFYRVKTEARKPEGLGLGLYISRLIVEALGGDIQAESELGQGSTFRFLLPSGLKT